MTVPGADPKKVDAPHEGNVRPRNMSASRRRATVEITDGIRSRHSILERALAPLKSHDFDVTQPFDRMC